MEGCLLPKEGTNGSLNVPKHCVGKDGLLQDLCSTREICSVGFKTALIIIHGLWCVYLHPSMGSHSPSHRCHRWKVQQFARIVHTDCGTPSEAASEYCFLSKRLEEFPDTMAEYIDYKCYRDPSRSDSADQACTFSLAYLYHLCVVYLQSCMVPVLSCSQKTPFVSRDMIRHAAEQAWEHSVFMWSMAEHFIARKKAISKSWAIVGYGAYVCAAIQIRRCLALGVLTHQRLQELKVHLRLTGELSKYWMTLRPLVSPVPCQDNYLMSPSLTVGSTKI